MVDESQFTLEVLDSSEGVAHIRVTRDDRVIDYGRIPLSQIRHLVEALLPLGIAAHATAAQDWMSVAADRSDTASDRCFDEIEKGGT